MNRDIQELREVVQKLVPLLAGKGLTVTQRGSQAYVQTNPRTQQPELVNIPNIPETAEPGFIRAIQGFIDHEVGHVLITNWKFYGRGPTAAELMNPEVQRFQGTHNIVEDTMIEKEMVKIFPGSERNISDLRKHFIDKITKKALAGAKDEKEAFRYLLVPAMRALSGHTEFQDFMDAEKHWDNPWVKELVNSLSAKSLGLLKTATTTKETLEVAEELHLILHPPKPPEPPKEEPKKAEPPKKPEPPKEEEKKKPEPKKEPEPEDEGAEPEEEKPEPKKEDPKDEEPEEDADEDEDEDEEETADPEEDQDEDSDKGDEEEEDAPPAGPGDGDEEREHEDEGDDEGEGDAPEPEDDADEEDDDAGEDTPGAPAEPEDGDEPEEDDDDDGEGGAGLGAASDEGDELEGLTDGGMPKITTDGDEGGGVGNVDTEEDEDDDGSTGGGVGNEAAKSIFDFDDDAFDKADLSSQISILISEEAVLAMDHKQYLVFTREMDRIEHVPVPAKMDTTWVPTMEDEVRNMTGRMQKDIERLMASQSHIIRTPGHRRGKLHAPSLWRVPQGDPRVFSQREEHVSKDTAVSLVCDNSGSMSGPKMKLAMTAAYALSTTLDRVKINHEVIGFTTGNFWNVPQSLRDAMQKDADAAPIRYDRVEPIVMPIYKEFGERISATVKARFAYMMFAQNGLAGNIDGESLEYAAIRLMKQKEKRKVMLVLSDGQPAGSNKSGPHLSFMVRHLEKHGIEMMGIGIMSTAVKRFYPNHVVLDDIDALPTQVMQELKRILS